MAVSLLLLVGGVAEPPRTSMPVLAPIGRAEAAELRREVASLFDHAYGSYLTHAFPRDVLQPLSCSGRDQWKGITLTMVDALDTLAVLGNRSAFAHAVEHCLEHLTFDLDQNVSVFETTIRALGGLLSAHTLALDPELALLDSYPPTDGRADLLALALDLGERLLPAFATPTGIPYGTVNLRHGVPRGESTVACTAAAGSLTLEFEALSRLTADRRFYDAARTAARALWRARSALNLVGAHIDVVSGAWTQLDSGVGRGIDSFLEYLLKAHLLFGDEDALRTFRTAYQAVEQHTKVGDAHVEVSMHSGQIVWPIADSLQAFWPGVQALAGDVDGAARALRLFVAIRQRTGWLPEGFRLNSLRAQPGQRSYPLRPELIESLLYLHHATGGHPEWRAAGRDILHSLRALRVPCGLAAVADVRSGLLTDSMESFALAETLKYLWLLFDDEGEDAEPAEAELEQAAPQQPGARAAARGGKRRAVYLHGRYVFTTEGHLLPFGLPPLPPPSTAETSPAAAAAAGSTAVALAPAAASPPSAAGVDGVRWRGACAMPTWLQRLGWYGGGPLEGGTGPALAGAMAAAASEEIAEILSSRQQPEGGADGGADTEQESSSDSSEEDSADDSAEGSAEGSTDGDFEFADSDADDGAHGGAAFDGDRHATVLSSTLSWAESVGRGEADAGPPDAADAADAAEADGSDGSDGAAEAGTTRDAQAQGDDASAAKGRAGGGGAGRDGSAEASDDAGTAPRAAVPGGVDRAAEGAARAGGALTRANLLGRRAQLAGGNRVKAVLANIRAALASASSLASGLQRRAPPKHAAAFTVAAASQQAARSQAVAEPGKQEQAEPAVTQVTSLSAHRLDTGEIIATVHFGARP
jgi:mannosidase alpha-like ER degradation enhancer 2